MSIPDRSNDYATSERKDIKSELKEMPKKIHKNLASGRWFELSLVEQLANVGSDIERTIAWKKKGDLDYSQKAFERALELLDLTIADPKNRKRLKEIVRTREALVDHFMYDNEYQSTNEIWQNYFFAFNYAAALKRRREKNKDPLL